MDKVIPIITPPVIKLYSSDDKFIKFLNEYEFMQFRLNVILYKLEGYYFKDLEDNVYNIDKTGYVEPYPPMFNLLMDITIDILNNTIFKND